MPGCRLEKSAGDGCTERLAPHQAILGLRAENTLYYRALSLLRKCPSCAGLTRLRCIFTVMLAVIYICWVKDSSLGRYRQRQSPPLKIELNDYF